MKASVVIRTFNNEETIGDVLRSLEVQTFRDHELVIVDSGSTDGTLDLVGERPHIFVNYAGERFSYPGSLNAGCAAARGEYVVFLSSHCVPLHRTWLADLVGTLEADEHLAGAWGPLIFELEAYPIGSIGVEVVSLDIASRQANRALQNPNSIIRRTLWAERPFCEGVFRCEDQEWAHHFLRRGYRTAIVHGAPVHYKFPARFFRFARKTYRDAMTLYDLFGYVPAVPTAELYRRVRWRLQAIMEGKRSVSSSKLVIGSLLGRWSAHQVIRARMRAQGLAKLRT